MNISTTLFIFIFLIFDLQFSSGNLAIGLFVPFITYFYS